MKRDALSGFAALILIAAAMERRGAHLGYDVHGTASHQADENLASRSDGPYDQVATIMQSATGSDLKSRLNALPLTAMKLEPSARQGASRCPA